MIQRKDTKSLILYEYFTCPFCFMTRRAIKQLGIDIERRDILKNPEYRKELIAGGGKPQVPCLRIENEHQITWLYESADIIRFLNKHFAQNNSL